MLHPIISQRSYNFHEGSFIDRIAHRKMMWKRTVRMIENVCMGLCVCMCRILKFLLNFGWSESGWNMMWK